MYPLWSYYSWSPATTIFLEFGWREGEWQSKWLFAEERVERNPFFLGGGGGSALRAPQLRVDLAFHHSRYINRPPDRLALCPQRLNQNPAQIPYFDFAFLWLWLMMISFRTGACTRALFFVSSPNALGAQLPFEANRTELALEMPRQAFWSSLLVFHTQEIDDWCAKLRFQLKWPLIGPIFRQCSKNVLRSTEKTTSVRYRILDAETGE